MKILVIEDEVELAGIIQRVLARERHQIDLAYDGLDGLDQALSGTYDLIILDRMLPGMDGLEICRRLRGEGLATPVLILSALGELSERVEGLDIGADDYLPKPFAFEELLARVRALSRRAERPMTPSELTIGRITLDDVSRQVTVDGERIELSPTEFALLEYLMLNAGRALTRDQILERVWGYEADPEGNVVDLYIHYLRRKLSPSGQKTQIETVRGVGYVLRRD